MQDNRFLLLLGPSGVGKSTIIKELRRIDGRFVYISPYMTRPLREGETDKIPVSNQVMDEMQSRGEFISVNDLYGIRYGCPRKPIIEALGAGKFPVLDWPIQKLDIMEREFGERLFKVYVAPTSIEQLAERIAKDGRDTTGSRLENARAELRAYWGGSFERHLDVSIISHENMIPQLADEIYIGYLNNRKFRGHERE